jgi:hypothetical protein
MARLKSKRTIQWAGVEFQPDLLKPVKPIRLGVILFEVSASSVGVAITGRKPIFDARPEQFKNVSDVTMALAANWIDSMFKGILEGDNENVFDLLAKRWRWNLYLIEPKMLKAADIQGSLESVAKKRYEKFVGIPFKPKPGLPIEPASSSRPPIDIIPPAWQLEDLKRQSMMVPA